MSKKTNPKKEDNFSVTEVGTLVESFRNDIKIIAEGHSLLNDKVDNLSRRVDAIAVNQASTLERVTMVEITQRKILTDTSEIKVILSSHDKRLTRLETACAK